MQFLIAFLVSILVVLLIILLADWIAHLSMTKNHSSTYGWDNFEIFVVKFKEYGMEASPNFRNSFFPRGNILRSESEYHANIIRFNDEGMLLPPIDFIRAKIYCHIKYEESATKKPSRNTVKWK